LERKKKMISPNRVRPGYTERGAMSGIGEHTNESTPHDFSKRNRPKLRREFQNSGEDNKGVMDTEKERRIFGKAKNSYFSAKFKKKTQNLWTKIQR